jgi:hypothetical protein
VPEKLSCITMDGEYYTFTGKEVPHYTGMDHVFGVGNVVTGQGNIRVSLVHSQKVARRLVECMSGDGDSTAGKAVTAAQQAAAGAAAVSEQLARIPPLSPAQMAAVASQVRALQQKVGFISDYDSWIAQVTPPDLE